MPRLARLSGRAGVRALGRDGWTLARQRGSHLILVKDAQRATLSIPNHREIAPGTLRALIRASGLTPAAFPELSGK
jgi:predicted RNA binding protein YcfA (HicA-like mRNA interferase family)